jgi:hypothetical protein
MTYQLIYRVDLGNAQSPFRVVAQPTGREVGWINRFLDQCCVRGLGTSCVVMLSLLCSSCVGGPIAIPPMK